jgi:hypothetical protein
MMFTESLAYDQRTRNSRLFQPHYQAPDRVLRKKLEEIADEMERLDTMGNVNVLTATDKTARELTLADQAKEIQAELYRRIVTYPAELM